MVDYHLARTDRIPDIFIAEKAKRLKEFGLVTYLFDEVHDVMAAVDIVASHVGISNVYVDPRPTHRNGQRIEGKVGLYVRKQFLENSWDRYYRDFIELHRWANKRFTERQR